MCPKQGAKGMGRCCVAEGWRRGMRGAGERLGEFPVEFPCVTKSTVGTSPNSAKFATSHIAHCTVPPTSALQQQHMSLFLFFFFRLLLIFLRLQVPRTPLSLANHEGGCLLFFSRHHALSTHKRVVRRCRRLVRLFFFFLFSSLMFPSLT